MVNLLGLTPAELSDFCAALGEKPYRAKQLLRWIHHACADDFAAMTDISKALRERLQESAIVVAPSVRRDTTAGDGTRKWLLDVGTGNAIETVFIPEAGRGTLCISSQAGCALECSFCSTGRQGFNRNLTVAEIIGQLWLANRALGRGVTEERPITNVVMMGMGEPLANFDNVVAAMELMLDDSAYGLSRRRVTLSTSGPGARDRPAARYVSSGAGGVAARAERRIARRARADQPQVPDPRAPGGVRALHRESAARFRDFRVRDAGGRERQPRPRTRARDGRRGRAVQVEPDPFQSVSRFRL